MIADNLYKKKFSVGLNLGEKISDIELFLKTYACYLSSVYFSLPLGVKFYSRENLEKEYTSEQKLFDAIALLDKYNIRTEVTINTYKLEQSDLLIVKEYMHKKHLIPDEIVCIEEYGPFFKESFPTSEIKYSFNSRLLVEELDKHIFDSFDTYVVGKKYLRSSEKRAYITDKKKSIVLLLNNGCIFDCNRGCLPIKKCEDMLKMKLKSNDINYYYALQSFFPYEFKDLLKTEKNSSKYRFKISNRPLGLEYTKRALEAYINWDKENTISEILKDSKTYVLFCTLGALNKNIGDFDIKAIMDYKERLQ